MIYRYILASNYFINAPCVNKKVYTDVYTYTITAPLSAVIVNRFSCRTAMILGGVCFTTGFVLSVFAPTVESAIFTVGILAGIAYFVMFIHIDKQL